MPFAPDLREKLLLWCDRRCCLCKKACDVFIEIHHIVPEGRGGGDDEDNAIPLCFDCHARVGHYDADQPRGSKFRPSELKRRRDQVYDECTRHLVPPLRYRLSQGGRRLPDIGFTLQHPGGTPPVRVLVTVDIFLDGRKQNGRRPSPMYQGKQPWNLNPGEGVSGHFQAVSAATSARALHAGIRIEIVDIYERHHALLPVTYVYGTSINDWILDPVDAHVAIAR